MKLASMLRRLRNTRGGTRSTRSTPYTPYMPEPPVDPPPVDPPPVDPPMPPPAAPGAVPIPPVSPSTLQVTVMASSPTVYRGVRITFTGSVENAPEGVTLNYSWTFGDGATDTQGINELISSCKYDTLGEKTVTLTVRNGNTVLGSGSVTINVESQPLIVPPLPPVTEAGSNQLAAVNKEVSFDGSDSTSPYGGSLRYLWVFGDERDPTAGSNEMMPSYAYTTPGTKRVTLIVIDEETGLTDSDEVTITVIGVTVTGDPRVVAVGDPDPVEFRSTVSNAPEGADLSYSWDFGDGAIYQRRYGSTASCQYTIPGDQTVTLTVGVTIEGQEVEVEGTCVIKVFKVDAGDPQIVAVGDRVQFAGSVLNAPEDADLTYSWAFDEGATNAEDDDGLTPSCVYASAGKKIATLTVRFTIDGVSVEGSGTVKIRVLESRLRVQGARGLSLLEKAAVRLVFGAPDALSEGLTVQVDEVVTSNGVGVGGSYGGGIIKISRVKHQLAEDLDGDTTVDDIDLTIPTNIKYLATLVHEIGHHWQSIHNEHPDRIPNYEFDNEVLETLNFVCKEQHAAVGQVYFILKWQLHHGHDPINLTDRGHSDNVGPAGRYASIADIPYNNSHRYIDPPEAIQLVNNFDRYLADLRR